MPANALKTLAEQLRGEGTLLSSHVVDPEVPPALGELAAAGSAAADDPAAYALVVEAVREGYLLHYYRARVIAGADADLRLLAGDYLYALGLERLAGLGDLAAVRQLSDLISLGAQLHADGPGDDARSLGNALWMASVIAVATGGNDGLEEAKFALRAGNPGARAALDAAAAEAAASEGLSESLAGAAHSIDFPPSKQPDG